MPLSPYIIELSKKLRDLKKSCSFETALEASSILAHLLQNKDTGEEMKILNVTRHGDKVSGWFNFIPGMDIPASYQYPLDIPVDFKVYWLQKSGKQRIAGCVNFTENFEDDQILFFDKNIGIDIIIPNNPDRIFIVLSSGYKLRILELDGELSVTQEEILQKWGQNFSGASQKTIHEVLWQSFNLKSLNQKFYEGIARKFTELTQHLLLSGETEHDAKHFTNRLIGRIIFLWFLRKKNIINEQYGYFQVESIEATDYYQEKLSPLFFDTLNKPIDERDHTDIITPYLNGGLFESRGIDRKDTISFPKTFFRDLYEFLTEYNFTTDESTSSFEQVAIDPEMLGRIFENLLAEQVTETGEQARKAKGAFYTPREIVDYMCATSLKTYLEQALEKDEISISDKEKIIKHLFEDNDAQFALYKKNESYDAISKNRGVIISALDRLTVLDPACGSGAFPMGMMQAMIRIYERTLTEAKFDATSIKLGIIERSLFGVDIEPMAVEIARLRVWLSIVVDEPNDSKLVKPLPNLDFKFICANSLIPLTSDKQGQFGDDLNREDRMQEIRYEYFKTNSRAKKEKLRKEFETLVGGGNLSFDDSVYNKQLSSYHIFDPENSCEFFDPKFMFGIENGFDVVIGNPPYGGTKISDDLKHDLGLGSKDVYGAFLSKSINNNSFLRKGGVLSFIVSDTFMTIQSHTSLRKQLLKQKINKVIRLHPDTFNATVNTALIFMQKTDSGSNDICEMADFTNINIHENYDLFLKLLEQASKKDYQDISDENHAIYYFPQGIINKNSNIPFYIGNQKIFSLMNDIDCEFIEKNIAGKTIPVRKIDFNNHEIELIKFGDIADIKVGLQTGDNEYYIYQNPNARGSYKSIDNYKQFVFSHEDLNFLLQNENIRLKAIAKGFHKSKLEPDFDEDLWFDGKYIVPHDKGGESDSKTGWLPNYFVATDYFIDWSQEAVTRMKNLTMAELYMIQGKNSSIKPEHYKKLPSRFQNSDFYFKHGLTLSHTGVYSPMFRINNPTPFNVGGSCIFHPLKNEYVLGILNSKLIKMLFKCAINHTVNASEDPIKEIPFIIKDSPELVSLVSQIINKQKENPRYDYINNEQKKIDSIVYGLYGLNTDDIKEVEKWYSRKYPKLRN